MTLIIKRQNYTKTIYSKEYKQAVEEIAKKFPPEKETTVNHTIKLTATAYTTSKRELITDKFTNVNKDTMVYNLRCSTSNPKREGKSNTSPPQETRKSSNK